MAENQWGKSPPKGKSSITPDMIKESFWGPAEVPDQVRGTPRVTTWGGPRPWEEAERPEGIDASRDHDSWVADVIKGDKAEYDFESQHTTEGEFQADYREQGPGDADSWVAPVIKGDKEEYDFESEHTTEGEYMAKHREQRGLELPPNSPNARSQGLGDAGELSPLVREQGPGEADSWVGGEVKPGTAEYGFDPDEVEKKAETWKGEVKKGEKGEYDFESQYTVEGEYMAEHREQGPGAADSWVEGLVRRQKAGDYAGVNPFVREVNAAPPPAPPGYEVPEKEAQEYDPWKNDFVLDPVMNIPDVSGTDFSAPEASFDTPFGSGSFNTGGYSKKYSADEHLDPFIGGWNFRVKIDKIPETHSKFVSVSGITIETENIEFKYGEDAYLRRIPGKEKFGEVELTRLYQVGSSGFSQWRNAVAQGKDDRRTVTIQIFHTTFDTKVMEVKLMDAFLSKWEAPELNAGSSDGALEKITLVPHHIIINDGETSVNPSSQASSVGTDFGTPPPKPLSLDEYYQKIQAALDAAMARMGVSKGLEDGRSAREKQEEERQKQADKAAEFRKKQKEARANKKSVREQLADDLEASREAREAKNKEVEEKRDS